MGEQNGARNAAPDAQSGAKSGAQDVTSDGTRATASQPPPPPPSRKSSRFIRANYSNWAASAQTREGRTARHSDRPQDAGPRQRTGSHAALSGTKVDAQDSWATRSGGLSFVSCKQIGPGCGASNSVS